MIALDRAPDPALPLAPQPCLADTPIDDLGDRIATLSAQIQAATYHLLTMIREFDERNGWNCGFNSCAHWLNWRTGLALGAAREKVRVATALGGLPLLSESMRRGELSYSKARELTRIASPENENELLEFAKAGTAAHVAHLVRAYRSVDRSGEQERDRLRHESRYLQYHTDEHGMLVLRARLEPEAGAALLKALEAAGDVLYDQEREQKDLSANGVPATQRRADALGLVAETALNGDLDKGTRGDRYQVVVHVDGQVLEDPSQPGSSALEGEADISAETSRRLACDASKVVMRHDKEGRILDVGRKTRTISPALRRALTHRDKGCRFPGCEVTYCDAHHVKHWAEGGKTSLQNTVLLCRRHHRAVHEEGFGVKLVSDGKVCFFRPDGSSIPVAPSLPKAPAGALAVFTRRLAETGVSIGATTGFPSWEGGQVDFNAAVQWLLAADGVSD